MDYIFKSDFLDLASKNKNKNFQYYHWAEKKRVEKQKSEYEQFRKMWFDIQEEEEKDKLKNHSRYGKKSQKKTVCVKPQEVYQKNLLWKQGVQSKLERRREEKREEKEKEFELLKQSKYKQPKLLRDQEHKGPIKAWKQRFDNYLRARCGSQYNQQGQNDFTPKIDKNSRRITNQMMGKVEDRLIQYGEKLKQKKIEMETIYEQELIAKRNPISNQSIDSQISDVYWRLYKDGERLNQKRNEQKSQFTFIPQINQYSNEIASRITEKRVPLHQSKVINQKLEADQKGNRKQRKSTEKGFNDFLKRNDALLSKIQKNKMKKIELIKEKQNNQIKECTFTPSLNPKSIRMFANYNSQQTNSDFREKIENLSKIQPEIIIDQSSEQKKLTMVRSQFNELNNSSGKMNNSTQRIQRLHSDGNLNILNDTSNLFIEENDSISNLNQDKIIKINQSSGSLSKNTVVRYRSNESEFEATDRLHEVTPIYNINQQIEEDSIERERDNDWEKQLVMMERQIEAMMQRTNN